MDWPYSQHDADTVLSSAGPNCMAADLIVATSQAYNAGAVWPVANKAFYVPVWLNRPATVYKLSTIFTAQSGNYDIGLYDEFGHRLVSKGTAAVPAAGIAIADVADTPINPGGYLLALNVDNVVAAVRRSSVGVLVMRMCGLQEQSVGAVTLPATATFAVLSSAYCPLIAAHLRPTV